MRGTARTTRTRAASTVTASGKVMPHSSGGTARRTAHHPWFIIVVGAGFLILWIVALMTQVQTNEAFMTSSGMVNTYRPNWEILMQVPNLIMGNLSAQEGAATLFGWGIELVYLGFIVGVELLHDAAERSGQTMSGIFRTLSYGIVLFNGWTDYNYGTLGSGIWGHILFALVTSFIVGFFGTIGMYLLECGWSRA